MAGSRWRSRRSWTSMVVGCALVAASCSSGGDVVEDASPSSTVQETRSSEPLFRPADETVDGSVVLADDVVIATSDGEIPAPTTNPPAGDPAPPSGDPSADPEANAPAPSASAIPLPDPASVQRVVSMSATHTETLFAIGAGDLVVAVDRDSDFPGEAFDVRDENLDATDSDLTTLQAYDPDLVIVGSDATGLVARLDAAGIPSYSGPPAESLDDVYKQINEIGLAIGRSNEAQLLVEEMRNEVVAILDGLPPGDGLTFFHEIDPSLFTLTGDGYLANIYGVVGLTNAMDTSGGDLFSQVTDNDVFNADPDVIVLADARCCGVTPDLVAARPGWESLSAVTAGAVVPIDDVLARRWGPRVVDLIRSIALGYAAAA